MLHKCAKFQNHCSCLLAIPGKGFQDEWATDPAIELRIHGEDSFRFANASDQDHGDICLMIYAIEGENFAAGSGLSTEVKEAVREVVEQLSLLNL